MSSLAQDRLSANVMHGRLEAKPKVNQLLLKLHVSTYKLVFKLVFEIFMFLNIINIRLFDIFDLCENI